MRRRAAVRGVDGVGVVLAGGGVGGAAAVLVGKEHGVDARQVLARDHLGQVPAERAVCAREVVDVSERVDLVHDDVELVIESRERLRQTVQRLARRPRLCGVEKEEDDVRAPCEPLGRSQEVIAPLASRRRHCLLRIDHPGRVDDLQPFGVHARTYLEPKVVHEVGAETLERSKPLAPIADERRAITVDVSHAGLDHSETVIRWGDARVLHAPANGVVNEA
mmetsp:Transcript_50372/g.109184  ORF Transcript_50372/g.109184 Transcript_50372/m.109184 type:complete len:221 (-) Transcript_50372:257-919(-)